MTRQRLTLGLNALNRGLKSCILAVIHVPLWLDSQQTYTHTLAAFVSAGPRGAAVKPGRPQVAPLVSFR